MKSFSELSRELELIMEGQNYDTMFYPLFTIMKKHEKLIGQPEIDKTKNDVNELIKQARSILKKNDRVVWFLKIYRMVILQSIMPTSYSMNQNDSENYEQYKEFFDDVNNLLDKDLKGFDPGTRQWISSTNGGGGLSRLLNKLAHILSLPAKDIQNTIFLKQSPPELIETLEHYEQKWKESRSQIVDQEEHHEVLIKFPDDKCWFNLNEEFCRKEGQAMGHCGNTAAYRSGDSVLSLREPKKTPEGNAWRPLLTFILHENGYLGEMKGRGNAKPVPEYYPYIVALLKLPIIKGISGGGYAPERNFAITDLPQEEQDALIAEKPNLANLLYQYNKYGMTEDVMNRIKSTLLDLDVPDVKGVKYNRDKDTFTLATMNLKEFIDEYTPESTRRNRDGNALKYAYEVATGDSDIDTYDWVQESDVENFIKELPDDILDKIREYCEKTYPERFAEYEDHDASDLYEILKSEDDKIIDMANSAVADGYRSGTEAEIYDDLADCLKNWSYNGFHLQFEGSADGKHIYLHDPVKLVISSRNLIEIIDNPDYAIETDANGRWFAREEGPVLDQPYHGWSDYDDGAAMERFKDEIMDIFHKPKKENENEPELDLKTPEKEEKPEENTTEEKTETESEAAAKQPKKKSKKKSKSKKKKSTTKESMFSVLIR